LLWLHAWHCCENTIREVKTPKNTHVVGGRSGAASRGRMITMGALHVLWMLLQNWRLVRVHGYLWCPCK
jgi:hypothetical protein